MDASQHRHHLFEIGQNVNVTLRDWTSKQSTCSKVVQATILEHVERPFGYDVRLQEAVTFKGHMPSPLKSKSPDVVTFNNEDDLVSMSVIFVKEFMLSKIHSKLRDILATKFQNLEFRVISAVHVKPPAQIEYINYHRSDGTIETLSDDRALFDAASNESEVRELRRRLSYKPTHFYGFTRMNSPVPEGADGESVRDRTIHFTMNRYTDISLTDGISWLDIEDSMPRKPEIGQLVCGEASQHKAEKAPSFDNWFICSNQFMRLVILIRNKEVPRALAGMSQAQLLDSLIIPKNDKNYYIPHEKPVSRYLYAAIYMLAVQGVTTNLPVEWNLPTRRMADGQIHPFEVWWPASVLKAAGLSLQ